MATVKLVPIKSLKSAKYNPASRLSGIGGMAKSIAEVGLLDPIKVSDDMEIIDGHRRTAAYKKLGLQEIEVIVLKGDAATLYSHLNSQAKKLTGNETLNVFLSKSGAVSSKLRLRFAEAEENLGRPLLRRMAKGGFSLRTYSIAKKILVLNDRLSPANLKKAVKWMMDFGMAGAAEKAIDLGTPPGTIWQAIERGKAIRVKFGLTR